jgi:hypothetical protein
MIPLAGFLPDADPALPGVLVSVTNLIPTQRGMAGAPSPIPAVADLPALAGPSLGAATLSDTLGIVRTFSGTTTALYELTSTTWTDVSRASVYTGSVTSRWVFAQFGNVALASNGVDVIQASTGADFADIATAPKAKIIVSAKDFVLAFDTTDGTFGAQSDRWWCSAFQDYSDWTPSITTQATTGRLVGIPGGIIAAAMLGTYVVAYKKNGVYVGQYVGAPAVWQWDTIPGEFGCIGQGAVADLGGMHFVVGPDNFWLFDGTRPVVIGENQVREWFYRLADASRLSRTLVHYDQQTARVWIHFATAGAADGKLDAALVYDLRSKRWGRADRVVEAVFQFTAPGITWDTFDTLGPTWADLVEIPYDSPLLKSSGRVMSSFDATGALVSLAGSSSASEFVTGDMGQDHVGSNTETLLMHFLRDPTTAQAVGYVKENPGEVATGTVSSNYADGKIDIRQSGRWHNYQVNLTGDHEISAIDPRLKAEYFR